MYICTPRYKSANYPDKYFIRYPDESDRHIPIVSVKSNQCEEKSRRSPGMEF